ncbi:MAG: hypothetical protein HYY37_03530 [Candidatus Aenigmarchaeota archaeon]|nr:hypothetical protein [Candidatus Aenigmarchaeota archaeon]
MDGLTVLSIEEVAEINKKFNGGTKKGQMEFIAIQGNKHDMTSLFAICETRSNMSVLFSCFTISYRKSGHRSLAMISKWMWQEMQRRCGTTLFRITFL